MIIEFFIAFFGIIYIVSRLTGEKFGDLSRNSRRLRFSQIKEILEKADVEKEIIAKAKENGASWIWKQIPEQDLAYVLGDDWKKMIDRFFGKMDLYLGGEMYSGTIPNFSNICSIITNIYMSQLGLVRENRLTRGYQTWFDICGVQHEQRHDVAIRTCQIIDRNIRRAHPDLRIYLAYLPCDNLMLQWNVWLDVAAIRSKPYFKLD